MGAKKGSGKLTALLLLTALVSASITIAFAETDANAGFNQANDSNSNEIGSGISPTQELNSDSNNNAIAEKELTNPQIDSNPAENPDSNQLIGAKKETQPTAKEGFATITATAEPTFSQSAEAPDSNTIGAEIYSSNLMFCSNQPTGQYCENLEASCNRTTWSYPSTAFYNYMRIYEMFHNNNYDFSVRIDADNPNREDIRWWNGSEYVDHLLYTYKGTGNWAYLCNAFGTLLPAPTGQWRMKFALFDNMTREETYFSEYITIKCDNDTHCPSNQACRSNQCIECTTHSYSKCVDNDLYWFDSCDRQQEMKEDCRVSCGLDTRDGVSGYYCSNGCKGNWKVYAFDLWRNGKPNATVQLNLRDSQGWQFAGQTNSSGLLEFTKILPFNCGRGLDLKAISAEGANCGEKYGFIEKEDDTDTYFFLCPETKTNNQLHISMNSNKKEYQQEEQIQFSFNIKDNIGQNVQEAFIGLILPDEKTATAPLTDSSGNSTLALTAAGEGVQKFTAIATKEGYKSNSTETTLLVKEKPKTVIEVKGTDQQPVPRATIYINGAPAATTNQQGKAVIATPAGTSKIEVESGEKSCSGQRLESIDNVKINVVCSDPQAETFTAGWMCKDSSTMAYRLSDGSYLGEIGCIYGCKDGACKIPLFLSTSQMSAANVSQELIINPQQITVDYPIFIGLTMVIGTYLAVALGSIVVVNVGTSLEPMYNFYEYQHYDNWVSDELAYEEYFKPGHAFYNLSYEEWKRRCIDEMNKIEGRDRFVIFGEPGTAAAFASYDYVTRILVVGNLQGKIFHCQIINHKNFERMARNRNYIPYQVYIVTLYIIKKILFWWLP